MSTAGPRPTAGPERRARPAPGARTLRMMLVLAGCAAVPILLWYVGPLVAIAGHLPLGTRTARIVAIALFLAFVLWRAVWLTWRSGRAEAALSAAVVSDDASALRDRQPSAPEAPGEQALLARRFAEALAAMRRSGRRPRWLPSALQQRYLYERPWYVVIGAPGSGKTTALLNAGLTLPRDVAREPLPGVAGTRNCDWLLADEAVLIDTAGRYATQDSTPADDAAAWHCFLDLLKRNRPRRPVNGILVAVSVADLLHASAAARTAMAASLRARLHELREHLGIRFPVYVIVTKVDLLAGFDEFFGNLGRDELAQVWGTTFALEPDPASAPPLATRIETGLGALGLRLDEGLTGALQDERDPARRSLLFGFPQQWARLRDPLQAFLGDVFRHASSEPPPLVRGVYFTSATREGTTIDRVLGELARSMGVTRVPPSDSLRHEGRSVFLARLLRDVVFAERQLAGTDLRGERRRLAARIATLGVATGIAVVLTLWWIASFRDARAWVRQVAERVPAVEALLADRGRSAGAGVVDTLPALDAVRSLTSVADGRAAAGSPQSDKLDAARELAYRRLLHELLVPRIVRRLETVLANDPGGAPDRTREALKAYLMLHDTRRFDAAAFEAIVTEDWTASLPRETTNAARTALRNHLRSLVADGPVASPSSADEALIARAREALRRVPLARRVNERLRRAAETAGIPDFSVTRAAGPVAHATLRRAGAQPIERGVPAFHTRDGYRKVFQPNLERVAARLVLEETWIDGTTTPAGTASDTPGVLEDARRLYLQDYERTWRSFIGDLRLAEVDGLEEEIRLLRALSSPSGSPLPPLLRAIVSEVTLAGDGAGGRSLVERGRAGLQRGREEVERLLGATSDIEPRPGEDEMAATLVDARFDDLRRLVLPPAAGQSAPLDAMLRTLDDLHGLLVAQQAALRNRVPPPPSDLARRLGSDALRLPEPLATMVSGLVTRTLREMQANTIAMAGESVRSELTELCARALEGRYPFVRSAPPDFEATPEDFAALFAPGGRFDDVFQRSLASLVDTTSRPWRFKQGDAQSARGSAALPQFQRAALIRDVFFRPGVRTPQIRLDLRPLEMDASIHQLTLDVDGQIVRYAHGPQVTQHVQWPGATSRRQVRLTLQPPAPDGSSGVVVDGPWALFRLFDRMTVEPGTRPERFVVTLAVGDRKARFEVVTASVMNPFRLRELDDFRCPRGV